MTRKEFLGRVAALEEECEHFLNTYLNPVSADAAGRRGAMILTQFQKLLGPHSLVEVVAVPLETVALGSTMVPQNMKGKLWARLLATSEQLTVVITGTELAPGVAPNIMPPRKTTWDEILLNGITPQQMVKGMRTVLHESAAQSMATQPAAQA